MVIDLDRAAWRKSTYSGDNGGGCVEVARNLPGVVAVRDSKDPQGQSWPSHRTSGGRSPPGSRPASLTWPDPFSGQVARLRGTVVSAVPFSYADVGAVRAGSARVVPRLLGIGGH